MLLRWLQFDAAEILRDILGQRGNPRGSGREVAVLTQHEAIILDHRSATGCRHQDGVEAISFGLLQPDGDIGARPRQCVVVASKVVGERAATLLVLDQHDLDAVARQEIDRGLIDARCQHLLGTALQQRDPSAPVTEGRKNASASRSRCRQAARCQSQHGLDSP